MDTNTDARESVGLTLVAIAAICLSLTACERVRGQVPTRRGGHRRLARRQTWSQALAQTTGSAAIAKPTYGEAEIVAMPAGAEPRLPDGFSAQLVTTSGLHKPRVIRVAPNGDLFVADSMFGSVHVLRIPAGSAMPERDAVFASGLKQPYASRFTPSGRTPNGSTSPTATAWSASTTGTAISKATGKPERIIEGIPETHHYARDIVFSPDGSRLFLSVGSGSNVALEHVPRAALDHESGDRATSTVSRSGRRPSRSAPRGTRKSCARTSLLSIRTVENLKIVATGLRNCAGMTLQPVTGQLWCVVNERDELGDNTPFEYATHVVEGAFYGWPWYFIGGHEDPRQVGARTDLKDKITVPDVLMQAHSAPLQMAFYQRDNFPAQYRGSAFVTMHGSWNRGQRTGYKVVRLLFDVSGKPTGEYDDFMTGFVVSDTQVWAVPVGVAVADDGSLFRDRRWERHDSGGSPIEEISHDITYPHTRSHRIADYQAWIWIVGRRRRRLGVRMGPQDDNASLATMRHALDQGVNWIDTAAVCTGSGTSEKVVGQLLREIPDAQRPLIFTKCGLVWSAHDRMREPRRVLTPASIRKECESSLRRLGIERIDLYQFHWPDESGTPVEESWATMVQLVQEGKCVRSACRISTSTCWARCEAIRHVDSLQPPFSLINRAAGDTRIPWCARHEAGVICYSPMQSGLLTDTFSDRPPVGDCRRRLAASRTRIPGAEPAPESALARCAPSDRNAPRNVGLLDGDRMDVDVARCHERDHRRAYAEQVDGWIDAASIGLTPRTWTTSPSRFNGLEPAQARRTRQRYPGPRTRRALVKARSSASTRPVQVGRRVSRAPLAAAARREGGRMADRFFGWWRENLPPRDRTSRSQQECVDRPNECGGQHDVLNRHTCGASMLETRAGLRARLRNRPPSTIRHVTHGAEHVGDEEGESRNAGDTRHRSGREAKPGNEIWPQHEDGFFRHRKADASEHDSRKHCGVSPMFDQEREEPHHRQPVRRLTV